MKAIKNDLNFVLKMTQNQLIQSIEFHEIPMEVLYNSNLSTMSLVSNSEDSIILSIFNF